jgi:hypothetical protein
VTDNTGSSPKPVVAEGRDIYQRHSLRPRKCIAEDRQRTSAKIPLFLSNTLIFIKKCCYDIGKAGERLCVAPRGQLGTHGKDRQAKSATIAIF